MSQGFELTLAEEKDDEALRRLLRQTEMPGEITLSFQREPSFFQAERAGNISSQTMIYRGKLDRKLYGLACRSVRKIYIDGRVTTVGYLSALRGLPEVRNGTGLARGYKYLHDLHSDGVASIYYTTIFDDNKTATELLTSGRASLPTYKPISLWKTLLIPLTRGGSRRRDAFVDVVTTQTLDEALASLGEWGERHQLAPSYRKEDVLGQTQVLPNFSINNWYSYRVKGETLGTLGVWDQNGFKQTVVTGYSDRMRLGRQLYNLYAQAKSLPQLPKKGKGIPFLNVSLLSIKEDDPKIFQALLDRAIGDWSGKGFDFLAVGLSKESPLYSVACKYATRQLDSTIYLVYWQEPSLLLPEPDMPVHVETATL